MATFYYKSIGEGGTQFSMSIGANDFTFDPITDGTNVWKAIVTNPDQADLDLCKAQIEVTQGVTIIDETEYNSLT